jgi:hypothetical protein
MRRGHAKHGRAARKETFADRQEARELGSRAFPAKRRTENTERKRSFRSV